MKVLLPVLLLLLFQPSAPKWVQPTDSLLNVLKSEILKKQVYDRKKDLRIDALQKRLQASPAGNLSLQYNLCNNLYDEYKGYKFDSAYVYSRRLLRLANLMRDVKKQYEIRVMLGNIQRSLGMLKEAFECTSQIDVSLLPDSGKLRYYLLKSQLLKDQELYNRDGFFAQSNHDESIKSMQLALRFAPPNSFEYYMRSAQLMVKLGQEIQAEPYYQKLLHKPELTYHQRAMVAFDLSELSNGPEKTNLLTQAAIYDIRSSNKQTRASAALGMLLFKQGDINDAELLLKEALDKAQFFGNKLSERELIANLTQVSAQKVINAEAYKNQVLTTLIIIAGLAFAVIMVVSFIVYTRLKKVKIREAMVKKQNMHLDKINKKLLEDGHIKEEYIGYFFNVISGNISKLEKIKRTTERKIKTKNVEDLLQLANEIDIKQERRQLFYTFDSIFLKLFPNFIIEFNSMFKPEDQIWPKDNELLNTNLRIFALMRLGIKDNQVIANILENTVNTVYAYKNRLKLKSLVKDDEFENRVMEIKF